MSAGLPEVLVWNLLTLILRLCRHFCVYFVQLCVMVTTANTITQNVFVYCKVNATPL